MLRLTRRAREGFRVAGCIDVSVVRIKRRHAVVLRIVAPGSVGIWRAELPAPTPPGQSPSDPAGGKAASSASAEAASPPVSWTRPERPLDSQGGLVLTRKKREVIHLEGAPLIGRVSLMVGRIGVSLREQEDETDIFIDAVQANSVKRWELLDPPSGTGSSPGPAGPEGPPGDGGPAAGYVPAAGIDASARDSVVPSDPLHGLRTVPGLQQPIDGASRPRVQA